MRFAENLINYVRENGFSVNDFALGDWLENLTDDRLTTLIELGEKFCQGSPEQEVDDFFGVAIYAASVERRVDKLNFTPEELFDLGCALIHGALVESHRRKKIAVVKGKIRLYPFPTDEISLPEQGRLVRHGYTGLH